MKFEGLKRNKQKLDIVVSVRISKSMKKFMGENRLSLSLLIRKALKDLGYKDE